jgi:HAE1 family hydrophobic/amphiphilic exporter-1
MTTLTFIVGVSPLVIASGAGADSRQALGTAVFGGMVTATTLLVVFVPVFYLIIQRLSERLGSRLSENALRHGK